MNIGICYALINTIKVNFRSCLAQSKSVSYLLFLRKKVLIMLSVLGLKKNVTYKLKSSSVEK